MDSRIRIGHLHQSQPQVASKLAGKPVAEGSFKALLNDTLVKFSHHAEVRMQQRGIALRPEQLSQLSDAIDKAAAKGAKDSLVLMRGLAMIVNVPSRTIVTAMDGAALQNNVFTQIDSAIVIQE